MAGVTECYRGEHVRVFRLDAERVRARLARAAGRLVAQRDDVRQVWLFGSLARGEAMPGSDADLLIVVRDGAGAFLDRSPSLALYFERVGVGCDVLVYTVSEFDRLSAEPSLVKTARDGGLLLSAGVFDDASGARSAERPGLAAPDARESMRAWVRRWQVVGPLLEAERWNRLRAMSTAEAQNVVADLLQLTPAVPRSDDGEALIAAARVFARMRAPAR